MPPTEEEESAKNLDDQKKARPPFTTERQERSITELGKIGVELRRLRQTLESIDLTLRTP